MKTRQRLLRSVLVLWGAAIGHAGLALPACSPQTFVAAPSYPAGFRPTAGVIADFNGDLVPDIATIGDDYGSTLSVLLGNGDGTFAPAQTTDINGTMLVAADFDGDGNMDLAVGGYDGVAVLLGNGDGTFQAPAVYTIGGGFDLGLLAADVTGDGKLDLVVLDSNPDITVLPGNGDGSFGSTIVSPMPQGARNLASGDFDGDGKLDLAATVSNAVAVLKGNGDGTFGDMREFAVAPSITGLAVGDIDNDGNLDIGVSVSDYAEVVGGYVGILLGNGDRTFAAAVETRVKGDATGLILRDFDGDGNLDAVVGAGDSFAVLLTGTGTASFSTITPYLAASGVAALASGDLNGDGSPDIVTVNGYDGSVSVLLNYGDGTFASAVGLFTADDNYGIVQFAAADLTGDGMTDLVVLNSDGLWLYAATGRATFRPRVPLLASGLPASFALADFNGDGWLDVATHGDTPGMMTILISNGDGTFQAPAYYPLQLYDNGQVLVGDFNGDGHVDLATFSGSIVVLFGNGNGTFGSTATTTLSAYSYAPVTGDFNGDGRTDIAFVTEPTLQVLLANADGTFQTGAAYGLPVQPYGLAAASVTGDDHVDLVVADGSAGLLLFNGLGDGTFGGPATVSSGQFNVDVTAADFDGDGIVDLATSIATPNGVSLLLGTGGGGFAAPLSYPTSRNPRQILAEPFGGTAPSVAVDGDDSTITILLNTRLTAAVGSVAALVGSTASLEASASGFGKLSYQWRKEGVPVPGATGSTLTIDPAAFTDAASYDVLVTDSCGTLASSAGTLSVEFADVPVTSIFHGDILTIATAGITAGCGGADYCPSALVSRAQMAVFLLKSEHGSAYVPPACAGLFTDVPCPSTYANWIEQLSNEGVTAGCGGTDYCPDASITRAQMAVFLLKTSQGSGYVPPAAAAIFGDVPVDAFAAAFIDDLYTRGIAGGCSTSPLLYCPDNVVNRAQMAAFLVNTFALP